MKTTLYSVLALIIGITISCKSIDKLVDQGRYDEAIVLATKKLAGKKKKKTKHIRALEEAFLKVNHRDLDYIAFLKESNDNAAWDKIYDYAIRMDRRQSTIAPFLPLVSNENYVGHFEFIDTKLIILEAREKAAKYAYDLGAGLLDQAVLESNKLLAQDAHHALLRVYKYYDKYENTIELVDKSLDLGTFHVLLKWEGPYGLVSNEYDLINRLNRKWTTYHLNFDEEVIFDAVSTLTIDNFYISPEREVVNNLIERKDLETWEDELDVDGNVVKDSTGQVVQYKVIERISAYISEYIRTKDATISATVTTSDFENGRVISSDHFTHNINFASDACTIDGDRRALSEGTRKRIDNTLLPFPADFIMVEEGVRQMEDNFMDHIESIHMSQLHRNNLALNR